MSIDNVNVTATTTSPCSTPTAQPTALQFANITDSTIQASFTASTSTATNSYIIIQSFNPVLSANPVNGTMYKTGDNIGDGTVIGITPGTSLTATNLNPSATYYFFVIAANFGCTGAPYYYNVNPLTGSATTLAGANVCTAPPSQAGNLTFSSVGTNTAIGTFTTIAVADEYLVVRSTNSTLANQPIKGTIYNPGDNLGNGVVVARGAANNFNATALAPNTQYYFFVYALNSMSCNSGPTYNTINPLTATVTTLPLSPCTVPSVQPTGLSLTATNTYISGSHSGSTNADSYLVLYSLSPGLSAQPVNGSTYNAGDNIGNAKVGSTSSSTAFLINFLTPGTKYYFFVFAANQNCTGGSKYLLVNPLIGDATTTVAPAMNYYFGNLHSHTSYSDGHKDRPGGTPADAYTYAKNSLCFDFLGVAEHNHAAAGMNVNNYRPGLAQARAATTPNFLALFGMEWGVISNGGHVLVYGSNDLYGWETNNYHQFVPINNYVGTPESNGTTGLFRKVNQLGEKGFAMLAHPEVGDFNDISNLPLIATADSAIIGSAIQTGPAFSTDTSYSDPGSMTYFLSYFMQMLARGYHVGPTIDHDNHNTTFGRTSQSRLAVIAPSLDSANFYNAMRSRHFYASEDCDTRVSFILNNHMMGTIASGQYCSCNYCVCK
jgi:hypothetical protein